MNREPLFSLKRIPLFVRALLVAATVCMGAMLAVPAHADTKISALPAGATIVGTEAIPAVQSAATVKTTPAAIDTYVKGSSVVTAVVAGGTNLAAAADDNVMVGNGTTWQTKAITSCSSGTSALTYNTSTNVFGCNSLAAGGDTYVAKSAGTARNTTSTLTADPDLVFTSLASGSYSFDGIFYVNEVSATPAYKFGFLASGAPTNSIILCANAIAGNSQNNWLTSPIAGNVALPIGSFAISCTGTVVLSGTTTLTYQWAQQTSDASNTTLNAGSYMHVHKTL